MARLAIAFALLLLTGCGSSTAVIDWVDFIQVGSTQYLAGPSTVSLQESDLGPVFAHVKFKVAGNVGDPDYRPKDGDAAFLEPGTPIYQVNGQPPSVMLAAHHDGQIVLYTAAPKPT